MANDGNLKKGGLSTERAKEMARKSAEVRKKKAEMRKSARDFIQAALNSEIVDKETGSKMVTKEIMIKKLLVSAIQNVDLSAIRYILELAGESPEDENRKGAYGMPTEFSEGVNIDEWIKERLK